MSLSNYGENAALDALFDGATRYVKLHVGDPGEDCTANAATETDRAAITFGAAASGVSTSDSDADWLGVAADETYSHVSIWDAATAGNPLGYGALNASKAVTTGDNFSLPAGDVTVTAD